MRPPVVAGLIPGAGASTLAAALHGVDGGVWRGGPVDVLVVRAGEPPVGVPVVVLVGAGAVPPPGRPGERVVLPVVPQWSGPDGHRAAAGLLGLTEQRTPAALRPVAAGLRAVVAALLRSGALERPGAVPVGPLPASPGRVRAPAPVRPPRAVPVLLHRATPVVPRLVAGTPLRWASGPAPVPLRPVEPRAALRTG